VLIRAVIERLDACPCGPKMKGKGRHLIHKGTAGIIAW
jgi:hypothetical protein